MQPCGCCRGILTTNLLLLLHHHLLNNADAAASKGRALLEFKSGISVDTTGILSTWLPTTNHYTDWEGDPAGSRPYSSSLSLLENLVITGTNHIAGNIPGTISNLTRLNQLIIEDSSIAGPIPPSLGSLRRLASVSLAGNRLDDSIIFHLHCGFSLASSFSAYLEIPSREPSPLLDHPVLHRCSLSISAKIRFPEESLPPSQTSPFSTSRIIVSQAGSRRLCSPYRVSETSR
ncbi:unnamed protein product [Linum trigynum]|uniref:Uncharacterized protein n=1 Tax=Linum trigynum TaxID=586398 RepID=A0AAV2EPS0_9ROSI